MSEAEKRVSELLDRWLASLELHARYLKLDDAAYAAVQPWPRHQRPNKWIIDLARQRVAELKAHVEERRELGDDEFADALELMGFLTSLLSSEHLERFVPLASPPKDATVRQAAVKPESGTTATVSARAPAATKQPPAKAASSKPATARPVTARPATPAAARRASSTPVTQKSAPRPAVPAARPATAPSRPAPRPAPRMSEKLTNLVIADAVRFLDWGREWPQLAGLIARLADRPAEKEIWDVLSAHRATIEARARSRRG
jgi:hypothetical protein